MPKRAPLNYPHSASWHQHRNKWESREFWAKHRAREKEELLKEMAEINIDKEEKPDTLEQ